MTLQQKADKVCELLKEEYPTVETPLHHKNAFELLVATVMSAQTLDSTVNKVTPALFAKYPTVYDLAKANPEDIIPMVRIVNYHKNKSANIIKLSQKLITDFGGEVPSTIEELITLPGVGRKTANVIIGEWFAVKEKKLPEGFVVDTHVMRVCRRLGLTKHDNPVKIEQDLMKLFPQNEWNDMSLRFIFHGRYRCKARQNLCKNDPVWRELCSE